jgi:cytochrome c-type biogenesis protein CcmH/NrfG
MMLDRDKISFWVRLVALALAVIFVGSFVFMGIGTNINYNLFDILSGGSEQQQQEQAQTTGSEEQITRAEQELEENPEDPKIIRRLAGLYLENGQTDRATEVLKEGRRVAPEDPVIPVYLGQAYEKKAQGLTDEEERQATYEQAGDAYATAAELQEDKPQVYLLAGQAYEQAGEKSKAIQYWNYYLELEPEGEQADAVKERIDSLLKGEDTGDGTKGTPKQ